MTFAFKRAKLVSSKIIYHLRRLLWGPFDMPILRRKRYTMEKKKGRGRPTVTQKIAGDNAEFYEKILTSGKTFRSRRSISDSAYMISAAGILKNATPEIEDLDLIWSDRYQCRSILSQLGRMHRIENYSDNAVISIAKEAIKGKKDGYSVKEIEQYIQHGRLTDEW